MLENKKLLFLTPEFYFYPELIERSIEKFGASVDLIYNRPKDWFSKFCEIFLKKSYEKKIKPRYFNKLLRRVQSNYDYILIIRSDLIPRDVLLKFKSKFPSAIFIQYIWDDIELYPEICDRLIFFNKNFSYNLDDCEKYNLIFRPFFFINSKNNFVTRQQEVLFVGAFHGDRLTFIEKILKLNPQIAFKFHLYINPLAFLLYNIPISKFNFFKFWKLNYFSMLDEIRKSNAVLDIQKESQVGLTTRVFEALGLGVKIISVNKNILNYDFYNPQNILIIDRDNPIIDSSWLYSSFKQYDEVILNKYNIDSWIKDVFLLP